MNAPRALRAFQSRNYRLFFTGQSLSLVGTWISRIATSWLVYRLTGSALALGIVGFAAQIPTLLFAPIAGVYVDRWPRMRLLLATQILSGLQSLAMGLLVLAERITMPEVVALAMLQGLINAFDMPVRQALVPDMVEERGDLGNAIALNSSMVNGARIAGPAIGGAIIAAVGEGWCFLLDAISYGAVILSILLMQVRASAPRRDARVRDELRDGFHYAGRFAPIRSLLLLLALVSTMGMPYTVLMPDFAASTLGVGAAMLGWLMAASGVGALAGGAFLAQRASVLGLGRILVVSAVTFGAGLIILGLTRAPWAALAVMPVVGAGFMVMLAGANTILQTIVSEEMRGRVMAFYTMAFIGTAPIGSLFAGLLAHAVGTPLTIQVGGAACLLGGIWFATALPGLRTMVRPIYRDRGILPPEDLHDTPPRA